MIKNITNVRGIKCWGAHCGVKSLRRDLAIIYSEVPASAAAVFTQNEVVAEPIKLSRKHISDGQIQAIVINAGNANACTGEAGYKGAEAMAETLAKSLGIETELVMVASTGLIGEIFPTEDIVKGIEENCPKLTNKSSAGSFAANAILTTDTFPKEGFIEFEVEGREIHISGIAKGSGMIHPNMATMLGFMVTDIAIEHEILQELLAELTNETFNMITVDGDTSTNDMVCILANGEAGNEIISSPDDPGYDTFKSKLKEMMTHLAKLIVSDGEGASKFVEYKIIHSRSEDEARQMIRSIASSNLVKTAMFGRDPNWGRIISAAGNSGIKFDYRKADLFIGDENTQVPVLKQGEPQEYDRNYMKKLLRESHIHILLDLNEGEAEAMGWGTDLSTDYVMFNSVYTT